MDKIVKKSEVPPKQQKETSFTDQPTNRNNDSTAISQSGSGNRGIVSQPTDKHLQGSSTGPACNTRSQSNQANFDSKKETWGQWGRDKVTKVTKTAQDVFSKDALMATGVSSDKPQQFKSGDRVVLQSVNDVAIYGTVRWVGDVTVLGQSVPFVGIETVSLFNLCIIIKYCHVSQNNALHKIC